MSEITALFRVSLARHRWLLLGMTAVVAVGVCVSVFWGLVSPAEIENRVSVFALFLSLLPAGIASIVLFDYGLDQDLNLPDSGCSHWILRMPVRSWKIAIVPIVLKTAWISLLWLLLVLISRWLRMSEVPVILPCIVFSAIAIWIMVLSWRPFRSSLARFIGMVLAIPILYLAMVGAFAAPSIERPEYRAIAVAVSVIGGVALYLGGVWCLIRSTQLARVNPGGLVPSSVRTRASTITDSAASRYETDQPIRVHRSQARALFHHDYQMSFRWIRNLYFFFVIPGILIFVLFVPVSTAAVVILLMLAAYWSGLAISRSLGAPEAPIELPVYLAASPLSNKTLAWTRQLFPLAVATTTYLCILLVIAGWACWASNREIWMRWAEAQAAMLEDGAGSMAVSPLPIGIRLSVAIVVGVMVTLLGRIAAFWWVGMTGRQWVSVVAAIVAGLGFLLPLSAFLTWFLRQTDWESTRESALYFLSFLPWLVGGVLCGKALVAVVVSVVSVRRQLLTAGDVTRAVLLWSGLALFLGLGFYLLLPYPQATLVRCLAVTALLIPLGRILVLPMALAWNRHR